MNSAKSNEERTHSVSDNDRRGTKAVDEVAEILMDATDAEAKALGLKKHSAEDAHRVAAELARKRDRLDGY